MPDRVERAERAVGLEVRPARKRGEHHRCRPSQSELETDVVGPQTLVAPVDERDLPAHVDVLQRSAIASSDEHELASNAAPARLRDAAHRGALDACAVPKLGERVTEPPRVDRHGLLDDLLEPDVAHLPCEVPRGRALLRRSGDAEAERM